MAPPSQKTLNWLHNVLNAEYRHIDRAYADIAQTLTYHSWISLRTEIYTFENGMSTLLLNLHGALPVSFRGTTYGFPVSVWIPREYPQSAPMFFITPTTEMSIRPGQHVSGEGRIYHPYLASWAGNRSNVVQTIIILQDIFAKEPPVVARPSQISRDSQAPLSPPAASTISLRGPPPRPPLPPELGASNARPNQTVSPHGDAPPPPPPKPFAQSSKSPPPLPPHPPLSNQQHVSLQPVQLNGHIRTTQPQSPDATRDRPPRPYQVQTHSYKSVAPPYPQDFDSRSVGQGWQSDAPPGPLQSSQVDPWRQTDPRVSGLPQAHPNAAQAQSSQSPLAPFPYSQPQIIHSNRPDQYLLGKKPPDDLLTSPFDAALPIENSNIAPPPIPPNPQKDALLSALSTAIGEQIRSTYSSTMSAVTPLRAQQTALANTMHGLTVEMSQLNNLESLLSSNETILHRAMRDADRVLEDAKRRQIPNVDDVLIAPTVVSRQLYEAVADERATEDCRNVLAKALDKGRINSNMWAKQTRSLAREEFLKKALIKKISRGMGLAEGDRYS